jgi:hypothetical protein
MISTKAHFFLLIFSAILPSGLYSQILGGSEKIGLSGDPKPYFLSPGFQMNSIWTVAIPDEIEIDFDEHRIEGLGNCLFVRADNENVTFAAIGWSKPKKRFHVKNESFHAIKIGEQNLLLKAMDGRVVLMFSFKVNRTTIELFEPNAREFKGAFGQLNRDTVSIDVDELARVFSTRKTVDEFFHKNCMLKLIRTEESYDREEKLWLERSLGGIEMPKKTDGTRRDDRKQ